MRKFNNQTKKIILLLLYSEITTNTYSENIQNGISKTIFCTVQKIKQNLVHQSPVLFIIHMY